MDKIEAITLDQMLSELTMAQLLDLPAIQNAMGSVRTIVINTMPQEIKNREYSEASTWDVQVVWRGAGLYAVEALGRQYTKDLVAGWESNPSSRTERFKKSHRFPLATALKLAHKLSPKVVVNGMAATDYPLWCAATDETAKRKTMDPTGAYDHGYMMKLYREYKAASAK